MVPSLLEGVKILDFTTAFVGTFCSRIMADMGADIIKIERPVKDQADRFTREALPTRHGTPYLHLNGGKKSLCVDLKNPQGLEILRSLVKQADVFVENFTPHVVRGYGLDYPNLCSLNPSIIMCSMTGYGQEGWAFNPEHVCTDPNRPSHERPETGSPESATGRPTPSAAGLETPSPASLEPWPWAMPCSTGSGRA